MVRQFEDCSWPFDRWTHRAHLAAGAYYRRHHPFTEALNRIRTSIQRYNKTRGDGTGYHETITVLYMHIIDRELATHGDRPLWELVNDLTERYSSAWLKTVYPPGVLDSDAARSGWVPPGEGAFGSGGFRNS
jgi:hypothetical protein